MIEPTGYNKGEPIIKLELERVISPKLTVVFTWDDNMERQISSISPIFLSFGLRCTFYIVPGEKGFFKTLGPRYRSLAQKGFEIGNHSLTHQNLTQLSSHDALYEIIEPVAILVREYGIRPTTFAFPHHDSNKFLIQLVKKSHLETRNTIPNTKRYSLKTTTTLDEVKFRLRNALKDKINIIFSGHSVISEEELKNGEPGEGYEPFRIMLLEQLLKNLMTEYNQDIKIETAEKCALDAFLLRYGLVNGKKIELTTNHLKLLNNIGVTKDKLVALYV